MRKNTSKKQHGFSLIETLIAVSILMIAIAGPLSLVQAGLFSSIHQRNQVTATYLAQEAFEYIKNIRDTNYYKHFSDSSVNWLTAPDGASLIAVCGVVGCYVDPHGKLPLSGNAFVQSVSNAGSNLYLNQTTNATDGSFSYSYATVAPDTTVSPYMRVVKITPIPNSADEVTVTVTINWNDNAVFRTYTVNENIYNYE